MGKVKPSPQVFAQWSPEEQAEYNGHVDSMIQQRDESNAKADQYEADASTHQSNADAQWDILHGTSSPYDKGGKGANMYHWNRWEQERNEADMAKKNAAIEREKASKLDDQIKEMEIEEATSCDLDYEAQKKQYIEDTQKQIEADKAKLEELRKKQQVLIDDYKENGWKYELLKVISADNGEVERGIKELQAQIDLVMDDLSFNIGNLDIVVPPPPPPPPPPPVPLVQKYVHSGAKLTCPLAIPTGMPTLTVLPDRRVNLGGMPMATIMDFKPMVNIPSMGMCNTLSNPQVAAATSAALGVLTPQPCVFAPAGPWKPGKANVLVGNQPALLNTDALQCMWGGVITILPG